VNKTRATPQKGSLREIPPAKRNDRIASLTN